MAIVGLAVIPTFAIVGLAVDAGRGYLVKARLSQAIDAAALAGGRAFDSEFRGDDIRMFFEANFPPGYMDATLVEGSPAVTFNDADNTITIEAAATVPTTLMGVAGVHELTVAARTVVQREIKGMELVLVMDNTGSMRSGDRIGAMREAARDLVDILYGSREEIENFWVGVVPYAATVNIGAHRTDWLIHQSYDADAAWLAADPDGSERYGYHPDHYAPSTWKGCVEARDHPRDSNDDPPSVQGWYPFLYKTTLRRFENPYWPYDDDDYVVVVIDDRDSYTDSGNVLYSQGQSSWQQRNPTVVEYDEYTPSTWGRWLNGDNDWDPSGPRAALKEANGYQNSGTGPNLGCGPEITPLTASKSAVVAAIDEMQPWHRGGTTSNLGLAWGWRVISPRWRGLWGGDTPADLPLDYGTLLMHKVIILLTDGNNEWYDWPGDRWAVDGEDHYNGLPGANAYTGSYDDEFRDDWPGADYTAYGRLNEGRLGTTSNGTAKTRIDQRMAGLCTAMKEEGIILFTITFQVSSGSTQTLFRNCATKPDYYFNSPTNEDLKGVFHSIAEQLSNLRIAQ